MIIDSPKRRVRHSMVAPCRRCAPKAINESANESADGADAELADLGAVVLTAIIEVLKECVVGGALRARPVAALFKAVGKVCPTVIQLSGGGQVEVALTVCRVLTRIESCRKTSVQSKQCLGIGASIEPARRTSFSAARTPFEIPGILLRVDHMAQPFGILAHAAVDAALASPIRAYLWRFQCFRVRILRRLWPGCSACQKTAYKAGRDRGYPFDGNVHVQRVNQWCLLHFTFSRQAEGLPRSLAFAKSGLC
ncbi:Unknown protein sequence [Pseudomonas syringae pv. cilantro]|uniref:Uncharacterized protein n=1 Tax=Pseudomonas syringae pv. cilantro TaxID=81035 RepID=A0A0N0XAG1_PSESX|nr:Unknown protein sequence [Pseudomonas syringae pv. cilantro]